MSLGDQLTNRFEIGHQFFSHGDMDLQEALPQLLSILRTLFCFVSFLSGWLEHRKTFERQVFFLLPVTIFI